MGKIICVIGNKGGTGKTTLSHMLAHGLGLFGMRAVAVLTDELRDNLSKVNRTYLPFDARSPDQLAVAAARLRATEGWIGVIDGGGNRPEIDRKLAAMADLVLLPFRDSHEDMRTVSRDLEQFPQAWALPSQWPTNLWAANVATRSIDSQMAIHKDRILAGHVHDVFPYDRARRFIHKIQGKDSAQISAEMAPVEEPVDVRPEGPEVHDQGVLSGFATGGVDAGG